jgi:hypothetical protein
MKRLEVGRIIDACYDELVEAVIARVKSLPGSARESGGDSPYRDVWEEYAAQVQEERSILFAAYEGLVESCCAASCDSLSRTEVRLLWLDSEAYWQWIEDEPPDHGQMLDDVKAEVARRVDGRAADWPLPSPTHDTE